MSPVPNWCRQAPDNCRHPANNCLRPGHKCLRPGDNYLRPGDKYYRSGNNCLACGDNCLHRILICRRRIGGCRSGICKSWLGTAKSPDWWKTSFLGSQRRFDRQRPNNRRILWILNVRCWTTLSSCLCGTVPFVSSSTLNLWSLNFLNWTLKIWEAKIWCFRNGRFDLGIHWPTIPNMTNPDLRKPAGFGIYTQVWGSELRKAARYHQC